MKLLPPAGPERRRQLLILGLLLPVLGYVLWSTFGSGSTTPTPPGRGGTVDAVARITGQTREGAGSVPAQAPAGGSNGSALLPEPVKLAALEPVAEGPDLGRNPFAYGQKPLPPPPPPPPPLPPPPPPIPQPPPPPPMPVSYIGIITVQDGRPIGAFRVKVGDHSSVENAYEGQVLFGQYRVIKMTPTVAVVGFIDGSNQRQLTKGSGGGGG